MLSVRLDANGSVRLGDMHIKNDLTGNEKIGNYDVKFYEECYYPGKKPTYTARVEEFPKDFGAWVLVARASVTIQAERRMKETEVLSPKIGEGIV